MGGFSTQSGVGNDGLGSVMNADNLCFNGTSRGECVVADGQLLIGSSTGQRIKPATLTAGTGISIANGANSITISAPGSTTDYHVARYIVSAGGAADGANYTTIASAITAAVAAGGVQTIAIQPGIYTKDLTWPANINLVAFDADALNPNVTIVGKLTCTDAGSRTASGIRFQTNSDNFLAVTGSAATVVRFKNCSLICSNATGITFSSSSASSVIALIDSQANLSTTGISFYTMSSPGSLGFVTCNIGNDGASTTASNNSAGLVQITRSTVNIPLSTSGTGSLNIFVGTTMTTSGTNTTCVALSGTGSGRSEGSLYDSGTATAITIGAGFSFSIFTSTIRTTNAAAISGAGTLNYAGLSFPGTSSAITVTTQNILNEGPSRTVGSSNSGGTNTFLVKNSSNTASSNALSQINVAGTSAGDPFQTFTVAGTTNWSHGIDNSVSGDPYVVAASTALGTTNVISATTAGEINYPLQPAFSAYLPSSDANVTGDGTAFQIGSVTAMTELFDQNSDFNTNGTFTAPVAGKYRITGTVRLSNVGAGHTLAILDISLSTGATYRYTFNAANLRDSNNSCSFNFCELISLAATNTVVLNVTVLNSTKTVSVGGGAGPYVTIFSGQLEC